MSNACIEGSRIPMFVLIALISPLFWNGCVPGGNGNSAEVNLIGQPAPGFEFPDLAGNEFKLEDARGNLVMLDFWATWCPPCLRALPHVQGLHEEFGGKGLVVLGINNEDPEKVASFTEEKGLTFRTLSDASGKAFSAYGVKGIPTTVLIDREGVVQNIFVGYTAEEKLRAAVLELGIETAVDVSNE
jgi:peroxiredoxin